MVTFPYLAHFTLDMKHTISKRWLTNPNWGPNPFPHNFPTHMWNLFIIKVKILMLIKCSLCQPMNLEWLLCFEDEV